MTSLLQPDAEQDVYQLLLVDPRNNVALLQGMQQESSLPRVNIPRYTRPAEQITSAVFEKWALHTVLIDWLPAQEGSPYCAVLEVLPPQPTLSSNGLGPISIAQIPEDVLPCDTQITVSRMLAGDEGERGPFSRFGWIDDAKQWIRENAPDKPFEFTDNRQLNASGSFALIRFSTTAGKAYWLKAVGEPNTGEFATTSYLNQHCREYLPKILAMRGDWNAWVMEEFGSDPHSSNALADFVAAASRLASLQRKFVGSSADLLARGFVDHRSRALESHVDELVDIIEEAMARQLTTDVRVLSAVQIRDIGSVLHNVCEAIDSLPIPDTLMHGDISPGSILSNGADCVFTDWCEAYVGNPLITFEQFCVHVARTAGDPITWRTSLVIAYMRTWREVLDDTQISRALQLVPLLSMLSSLYGRGEWLHTQCRYEPSFQKYVRGLARKMDDVIRNREYMEVLCHSV